MIDEISPEANRQKATVQVKVKMLNPDDYLRPEMNASVAFYSHREGREPRGSEAGRHGSRFRRARECRIRGGGWKGRP